MLSIIEIIKTRPELAIIFAALSSAIIYQLKTVPGYLWSMYKRFMTVNLEVDSECEAFILLDNWLLMQKFSNKNRNLQLINTRSDLGKEAYVSSKHEQYNLSWRLTSGFGFYIFIYKKTIVVYNKSRRGQNGASDQFNASKDIISGKLTALTRNREILIKIVDDLAVFNKEKEGTPIYIFSNNYWSNYENRKVRPIDSVILKKGQMTKIVGNIETFLSSKDHYVKKGIPYRRGFMLSGPPGTGKTSTILALAAHFNRSIYIISLNSLMNDREAHVAICNTAEGSFVVLEDIDCVKALSPRQKADSEKDAQAIIGVTTQGLLNILDGITTPENRMYFMTTNYPEKLDPAFLRPGRVDFHEVLDKLGREDQECMGEFFYESKEFKGHDFPISPAELQKAFIAHPNNPAQASRAFVSSTNKF